MCHMLFFVIVCKIDLQFLSENCFYTFFSRPVCYQHKCRVYMRLYMRYSYVARAQWTKVTSDRSFRPYPAVLRLGENAEDVKIHHGQRWHLYPSAVCVCARVCLEDRSPTCEKVSPHASQVQSHCSVWSTSGH